MREESYGDARERIEKNAMHESEQQRTIDALVAALQNMVDADELTKDDYDQAKAALAMACKGTI